MTQKKKKWVRPRHKVVIALLRWPLYLICKLRYRIRLEPLPQDDGRPYFILFNHQTAFDQFFVSLCFPRHVYYVSSEDLFSNGLLSRLISWLVAPIPFRKSTSDITALKNCIRIAREGGSIGMAPEGNRTYSGTTEYIKPGVASMVKALKLPLALYRIEGGYGAHPRWSDDVRKGLMCGYFSRIVEPEEYEAMTNEELFDLIRRELYVDERDDGIEFYSRRNAEYLDRAMYICPYCGLSEFDSKKDIVSCKSCRRHIRYLPDKTLQGVDFEFPYHNVKDWYDAQSRFIRNLDMTAFLETPLYGDTLCYKENFYCKSKKLLDKQAILAVYGDRFVITTAKGDEVYPFSEVDEATVLGRNKLNLYVGKRILQFKGGKHFNALKYLNLYYHARNAEKGDPYGEFLGL